MKHITNDRTPQLIGLMLNCIESLIVSMDEFDGDEDLANPVCERIGSLPQFQTLVDLQNSQVEIISNCSKRIIENYFDDELNQQ